MDYPADWEAKKLGEIGTFISGNGFPLAYQGKSKGTYPFYKVSDFNNEGNENYMLNANNYISNEVAKKLSCNIIPSNSVIFAKIGAAIFLERKRITACNCCIDNNMMSFQPFQNISSRFICYVMQKMNFADYVQTTALPSLSGKILADIKIPLPSLPEQKAIADTLGTFDAHIKNLSELIEKKKAIRDGALDDLMTGRTRLKNFSGDWEVRKLGEIGEWLSGSTPSRNNPEYYKNGKIFWVKNTDLNDNILKSSEEKITEKALKENFLKIQKPGTILIAMYCGETVGKLSILDVPATTNQNCCACELYKGFHNKFIFYSLLFRRKEIQGLSLFGGLAHISKKIIINYSIPLPPLPEQKAIAETLTAFDDEIKALEAERDKIKKIRDGAMNDLLTGKIRLNF